MKNIKQTKWVMMAVFMSVASGCGQSPILHHETAPTLDEKRAMQQETAANTSDSAATCALELPQAGLCASVTWVKLPSSEEEEGQFTLRFWTKSGGTAEAGPFMDPPNSVFVKLWMPGMGHGSSPVTLTKTAAGVYDVSRVVFVMGGDWQIRIQLKKDKQVLEEAILNVRI